ncbi:acetate--CoA ligase family protein [Pseudonocardia alaniniphila]|uniref:Acetate--CoA ligase family protein n=1 Tax=Pseudonocardia alaniniphila TaxID=75291 RepID=A0ABS9TSX1_9PSEU|nr:acetate--CoA ligase [Pseudonocardia alaniniphila]MCH6171654.1 acetate--CoA ligase family protein [Pseudonocardia alaniniphila]
MTDELVMRPDPQKRTPTVSSARDPLHAVLDPGSVAIIGASSDPDKVGGRPVDYLRRYGFGGVIHPVNPRRDEVQGLRTVPSLAALDEPVDVVLVAVPGAAAVEAVEAAAKAGALATIVMTAGFGETRSPEGVAQQQRMLTAARTAGMRLFGPNSQGLANFGTGAVLGFSTMFAEQPPQDGPVAVISQSGAMCSVPYGLLRRRGIGVRHAHATGNDADVTVGELAAAVAADPQVRLILLYLENLADPESLAAAARVARERDLPIVALMGGRSAAGQRAAKSHTGALAGERRVIDAYFAELGIRRAMSMPELVDTTELYLQDWRPQGRRLVVVSNSGAVCVLAADAAEDRAMPLAALSAETEERVASVLPGFATSANPIDVTAALLTDSGLFGRVLPLVAEDPDADAFLLGIPVAGKGYDVPRFAVDAAEFAARTRKPLVVAAPQESVAEEFRRRGMTVYPDESTAIGALDHYLAHAELRRSVRTEPRSYGTGPASADPVTLDEAAALARLADAGIPVVRHHLCRSRDEAVAAFAELGTGDVVAKGCSIDAPHKSELDLVELGLTTPDAVGAAYERLSARIRHLGLAFGGVIIAEQVRALHEMVVGARRDPTFGPVVLIGQGGKYVEYLPDVQVVLAPLGRERALQAIGQLRLARVLGGVRGEPAADVDALADLAVRVGEMVATDPGLVAIDVNPVMLRAAGEGAVVVDALVLAG